MSGVAAVRELDDALLAIVADWARGGPGCDDARFDELARATFAHQLAHNAPYARYAASLGVDAAHPPATWRDIPGVPSAAFKDADVATFEPARAERTFHTSGTTADRAGKHYVERVALYDNVLLAGFDRFVLPDRAKLRYLNLVPNPRFRPHSSLGYMMGHVSVLRGDGKAKYFLDGDDVDVDALGAALAAAIAESRPVCLAGTAFAFVAALDAFASNGRTFALPDGSRIMETGGFKGRSRILERDELYARLAHTFGIPEARVVAEYGMTELLSQYYDAPESRSAPARVKAGPPWLRAVVVDHAGREIPDGQIGYLRHVDLANRASAVAIQTEDRGYRSGDGFVLLGRDADAPARGCSLDADDLVAAAAARGHRS